MKDRQLRKGDALSRTLEGYEVLKKFIIIEKTSKLTVLELIHRPNENHKSRAG